MKNYFTEPTDAERDLSRRIRRADVLDCVGTVVVGVLMVLAAWAFLVATPDDAVTASVCMVGEEVGR